MPLDKLQIAQPQPANMLLQAMGMKDAMKRTSIAEDRNQIAKDRMLQDKEAFEFNKRQQMYALARDHLPALQKENYGNFYKWAEILNPMFSSTLPSPDKVKNYSDEKYGKLITGLTIGADGLSKMTVEKEKDLLERARNEQKRKQDLEDFEEKEKIKQKYAKKTEKDSALDKKIETIKQAYPGMDDEQAKRIALGTVKVVTDPFTGSTTLVDIGTKETIPMTQQGGQETPIADSTPEQTLWKASEYGTGLWSSLLNTLSIGSGTIGGPVAKKTITARQDLKSAQNDFIRALSINPRFPVGEIKRIKEEIKIEPNILDNPEMLRTRMRSIDSYLKRRLQREINDASDVNTPMTDRKNASKSARDIEHFIKIMGVPELVEATVLSAEDQALIDKYK